MESVPNDLAERLRQKRMLFEGCGAGTFTIPGGDVTDHALRAVHGGNLSSLPLPEGLAECFDAGPILELVVRGLALGKDSRSDGEPDALGRGVPGAD